MPEPGSPEWKARKAQMLTDELGQPLRWFYLSFANEHEFFGAVVVEAIGPAHALQRAHQLGVNPGGSVMTFEVPELALPIDVEATNRLLTLEEIKRYLGPPERVQ
jgi:hypothetical protein